MKTTDVPSNVSGMGAFGDILNRIFSCLKRRTIISGQGIKLDETESGVVVSLITLPAKNVIWIKACLEDGSECFVPVVTTGSPVRSNDGATQAVTVIEQDVPDNSFYL